MSVEKPLNIFISYSNNEKDRLLLEKLVDEIDTLKDLYNLDIWYDKRIKAGKEWDNQIREKLESTDIFILMLSREFLASEYIKDVELPKIFERKRNNQSFVIPVLLRTCSWERNSRIQKETVVPKKGAELLPVSNWRDKDAAFVKISNELEELLKDCKTDGFKTSERKPHTITKFDNTVSLKNIWEQIPLRRIKERDYIKLYDCDRVNEFRNNLSADYIEREKEDRNLYYFISGCDTQKPDSIVNRLLLEQYEGYKEVFFNDAQEPYLMSIPSLDIKDMNPKNTWDLFWRKFSSKLPGVTFDNRTDIDFNFFCSNAHTFLQNISRTILVYRISEFSWRQTPNLEKHLKYFVDEFSKLPKGCHKFSFFFILEISNLHKYPLKEEHPAWNRIQCIQNLCLEEYVCDCKPYLNYVHLLSGVSLDEAKEWLSHIIDNQRCVEKTKDDYIDMVFEYLLSEIKDHELTYYNTHKALNMDRLEIMQSYAFKYLTMIYDKSPQDE